MSDSNHIVSIKNLSHRYSKYWAVKDINFDIKENGIVGLLGSNGAGKSTTMNILCGIITPTAGKVEISGFDIIKDPIEAKTMLGFLPQKPPLYFDLTVDEYLYHCAHLRLIPKNIINNAVGYVKEYCGVSEFSKRLIGNLSGGYQQRVGIAQAIIHKPKLVVLDEPTNGLDPVQISEVRNLIRDISTDSSVLLSTHILSEVQAVCNNIIMIEKGNMVFEGAMADFNNLIQPNTLIVGMNHLPPLAELQEIFGVKHATFIDQHHAKLEVTSNSKVPEIIVKLSVEKDWGLFELHKEKVSLDSVFAKLSNRELKN